MTENLQANPTAPSSRPDMTVLIGPVRLRSPVLLASGTCGYGGEYSDLLDFAKIGGLFTKSITLHPRKGNAPPRTVETSAGMLNAIGLANIGLRAFCREKVPEIRQLIGQVRGRSQPGEPNLAVFVNVAGHSVGEYIEVCRALDEHPEIAGVELNVSCPNVADGLTFGTNAALLGDLVRQVRPHVRRGVLIVKLSPNVTDIAETARAAVDAGADALSLVNTYVGMAIDVHTGRPALSNVTGGLSGPAVKPLAIYAVHRVYRQVARAANVPIFGIGGIVSWRDAAEFILAGASAVVFGTATFVDPTLPESVADALAGWLASRGHRRAADAVGHILLPAQPEVPRAAQR